MDNTIFIDMVSLSINAFSLLVLIIILYGNFFELKKRENRSNRIFSIYGISLFIGVFSDTLSYAGTLNHWPDKVQFCITALSFYSGGIISGLFCIYLLDTISERKTVPKIYYTISIIACLITTVVDFVLSNTGKYFTVSNGIYTEYDMVDISADMSMKLYILIFLIIIRYIKTIGLHDSLALISYVIIPAIGSIVYKYWEISIEYAMMVVSLLLIFIMVQSDYQSKATLREQNLLTQSLTDKMTGLLNRAAHDLTIAEYEVIPRNFVYISFDLNGLKVANDTLGHAAGDELIKGAASCIAKSFKDYGKAFRVGGDEFAAILEADNEKLKKALNEFDYTVNTWKGNYVDHLSISYGYATIQEFCHVKKMGIDGLTKIADGRMYKSKIEYYSRKNQQFFI